MKLNGLADVDMDLYILLKWNADLSNKRYHSMSWVIYISFTTIILLIHVQRIE